VVRPAAGRPTTLAVLGITFFIIAADGWKRQWWEDTSELNADLKAATHRLANESAEKVNALNTVAMLKERVAAVTLEAKQLLARVIELQKGR